MGWPARWFAGVRLARNVYEAWRGYVGAKDRVAWLQSHRGQGSETVEWVKELRRGAR